MKKCLVLALTFAGATGVSLGFRHALHGPVTAFSRHEEGPSEPLTAQAKRPADLDFASAPEGEGPTSLRFAAARGPVEDGPAELLLARLAHDSGSYLLARAANAPGSTRLYQQAVQHLRACLSHEGHVGNAGTLFVEARRKLDAAERLIAEATRPPARTEEKRTGVPAPPPKRAPMVAAPRPAPAPARAQASKPAALKMVGPDGITFERAGE